MRVRDIMTRDPKTCGPEMTLQDAAFLMHGAGCGILPVLAQGRTIGVVTDRDICFGLAERDRPASEIPVSDAMSWRVYFCNQNDRISDALETMTVKQVRRLPVDDDDGRLCGILSIDDVILHSGATDMALVSAAETLQALQGICQSTEASAYQGTWG
jgi:CBS domain-containing protein